MSAIHFKIELYKSQWKSCKFVSIYLEDRNNFSNRIFKDKNLDFFSFFACLSYSSILCFFLEGFMGILIRDNFLLSDSSNFQFALCQCLCGDTKFIIFGGIRHRQWSVLAAMRLWGRKLHTCLADIIWKSMLLTFDFIIYLFCGIMDLWIILLLPPLSGIFFCGFDCVIFLS